MSVLATYSPCCGMIRKGHQRPDTMHTGLCRGTHEGYLGPTVYLVDVREIEQFRSDLAAREGEADRLRKGMESAYSIWSHAQEDCSVADRMADIINETLQGEAKHG